MCSSTSSSVVIAASEASADATKQQANMDNSFFMWISRVRTGLCRLRGSSPRAYSGGVSVSPQPTALTLMRCALPGAENARPRRACRRGRFSFGWPTTLTNLHWYMLQSATLAIDLIRPLRAQTALAYPADAPLIHRTASAAGTSYLRRFLNICPTLTSCPAHNLAHARQAHGPSGQNMRPFSGDS